MGPHGAGRRSYERAEGAAAFHILRERILMTDV
jgi:hypothetical protein